MTTPETLANEPGMYKLLSPPMGMSPFAIDRAWKIYERDLPRAIRAVEQNCYSPAELGTILIYIIAQSVRHPDFSHKLERLLAANDIPMPDADFAQFQRIKTMWDRKDALSQAQLAFMVAADGGGRLVLNDRCGVALQDCESGQSGLFSPLSSNLAALLVFDSEEPGDADGNEPTERLILTPPAVEFFNELAWLQSADGFVIGHPNDAGQIAQLDDAKELHLPSPGPYQNRHGNFFCWVKS